MLLIEAVIICSCTNSPHLKNNSSPGNKQGPTTKPSASFQDTVTINFPAAVFYRPDSLQLASIRNITDTAIFESTMHDCFYQFRNACNVLKKDYPAVRIIEVKNARYLLFKKEGGAKEYIDLDTKNDPCGLFIFDGRQSPLLTDMTNIETSLGFYSGSDGYQGQA